MVATSRIIDHFLLSFLMKTDTKTAVLTKRKKKLFAKFQKIEQLNTVKIIGVHHGTGGYLRCS